MQKISRFTTGNNHTVAKLNKIVNSTNNASSIHGDQFISVTNGGTGTTLNLNLAILKSHLAFIKSGNAATSAFVTQYEVIECPVFPTPENTTGQAWYTLRLASDTTADYNSGTTYALGDLVTDPATDFLYKSVFEGENVGHDLTDTDYWSREEEVKVERIWGYPTSSIFNFQPVIKVGAFVWVFTEGTGESIKYFILGTFLHVGDAEERTLTQVWNIAGTQQIVGAVFA